MKKMKFILPILIVTGFLLAACSANNLVTNTNESSTVTTKSTLSNSCSTNSTQTNQMTTNNTSKTKENKTISASEEMEIAQKTKEYIINGQKDKSEAQKLKWSEAFLNRVNIETVYHEYISAGGKADDIESFAEYLTQNASVLNNWKELFETDLLNTYGEKVSRYEPLQDNLYQVYVKKDGSDVPYAVVNARTGYFHR